jgi:hypothetical protein
MEIKEECSKFLNQNLGLTLSPDKTKVTNITEDAALFLGYSIRRKAAKRLKKVSIAYLNRHKDPKNCFSPDKLQKFNPETKTKTHVSRRNHVTIGIDIKRLQTRLALKRYCTSKSFSPREKPELSVLTPQEIIEQYNSVMLGLANYYYPVITYRSHLNRFGLPSACLRPAFGLPSAGEYIIHA